MALTDAFPGVGGVADTVDLRKDLAGLIVRDAAGLARAGVFPRHTNALVTARASMGVDVAAFEAALVRGGGPLFIANDGTVTVAIGAAPSSNSRYDVVYVKQNESGAPFSDASNLPVFGFVSGAAAASPSLSAALALVPVGGLPLAAVLIPSTATTTQSAGVTISQVFPYTALTGAPVWVRTQTERDATTWGLWQTVHRLDTGVTEQFVAADTSITPNRPAGWHILFGVGAPAFRVNSNATQALSNTEQTLTNWGTPTINRGFTSFAAGVLTVAQPGWYEVSLSYQINASIANGAVIAAGGTSYYMDSTSGSNARTQIMPLVAGDTITPRVFSSAAATANNARQQLTVRYIGPL